jgi:hypothetical protein
MKSNNHYIWDQSKQSNAYSVALSWAEQLKNYAKDTGNNPKEIRIVEKRQLTMSQQKHADCQIVWRNGPDDWAYDLTVGKVLNNESVCVEAHTGNSLSFYSI